MFLLRRYPQCISITRAFSADPTNGPKQAVKVVVASAKVMNPAELEVMNEIGREEKEGISWAKSQAGRKALNEINNAPADFIQCDSIEEYIAKRNLPIDSDAGMRMTSQLLTFPLSFAYASNKILAKQAPISALLVGARSESNLPMIWWKEALVTSSKLQSLSLTAVGPEVCPKRFYKSEVVDESIAWNNRKVQFHCEKISRGALHTHPKQVHLLDSTDIFVMYNPGYGSPSLSTQWEDTIRVLLQTTKPVICTSNSANDLDRDLNALKRIAATMKTPTTIRMLLPPHQNPFASRRKVFDPLESENGKVTSANAFIYAFVTGDEPTNT